MPHGGYKASGFGKDMSAYSFEEYTQVKHVMYDNTAVAAQGLAPHDLRGPTRPRRPVRRGTAAVATIPKGQHAHGAVRARPPVRGPLAAMRRSLTNGRAAMTRRSLLRASRAGALAAGGLGALSACGIPPAERRTATAASPPTTTRPRRRWSTSPTGPSTSTSTTDEKHRPTLDAFTKRTGIKVKYTEDINDNVEFFGKIKPQLAAGQDTGRDLMVLTDWLAARMIRLGWVQKLDPANLPHAYANLIGAVPQPRLGPGPRLLLPVGRASRPSSPTTRRPPAARRSPRSPSCSTTPTLKGRVALLSEMRDTIGMTLLDMGKRPGERSPTTTSTRRSPGSRRPSTASRSAASPATTTPHDLSKGDIAACVAWAGDVVQLAGRQPGHRVRHPRRRLHVRPTDNLLIPNKARHKTNAERLIDYYYEPQVAAELAAYINYVCPVAGVKRRAGEDRPVAGEQPADPPRRGDGTQGARLPLPELEARRRPLRGEVLQAHRRLTAPATDRSP